MIAVDTALKGNLSDTWDEMIFYKGNAVKVSDALILYRGNIVKVLDTSDSWFFVEAVCFVPSASKGYISSHAVLTGFSDNEANQGFIIDKWLKTIESNGRDAWKDGDVNLFSLFCTI